VSLLFELAVTNIVSKNTEKSVAFIFIHRTLRLVGEVGLGDFCKTHLTVKLTPVSAGRISII
jgi:hypothetical protein